MNETRKEILEKLKYLRNNRKDTCLIFYPNANKSICERNSTFLNIVPRSKHIQQSVMCSNRQDIEQINVTEIDKKSLLDFLNNLPDDAYLSVESYQDYDEYPECLMQAWYYRNETDPEYLQRISELHDKVKNKQQKKRCTDPEVNQYIEYLEKQLKIKE